MKSIQGKWNGFRTTLGFAAAIAVTAGILFVHTTQHPSVVYAQPPPPGFCNATTQPNIGAIANGISNNGKGPFTTDFNTLSNAAWCTFIWLNWPQKPNAKVGECLNPAGGDKCQVRWEQWLPSTSVYCSDGSAPNPATGCANSPKSAIRLLRAGANPGPRKSEDVGPGATPPLGPAQPTGFVLPDQNNSATNESVIFFESVEEPSLVKYLITHKLYNLDGQQALYNRLDLKGASGTAGLPPPSWPPTGQKTTPLDFPNTAFEIKPSWYIFNGTQLQQYGMVNAQGSPPSYLPMPVSCPTAPCPIGLTGFHILWKVFPKSPWFWATFEFKNNAQPPVSTLTIAPLLTTRLPNANLPQGATNVSKGPYVPYDSQTATDPMSAAANAANTQFRSMLQSTFLANYILVGVQVAPTTDGTPAGPPSYLANDTLETDFGAVQIGDSTGVVQSVNRSSSCITCHYNASIGSTNTTACKYDTSGKYQSGTAYFRRVPIYLRNKDARPPFTNNNGAGPCEAYSDQYGNPAGYTGPFQPSVYSHQCESKGSFVSGDFVWSIQEASWKSPTKGCPATRPPAP